MEIECIVGKQLPCYNDNNIKSWDIDINNSLKWIYFYYKKINNKRKIVYIWMYYNVKKIKKDT